MKFAEDRPYSNLQTAVRKLLEIMNDVGPYQTNRYASGKINTLMLAAGASPAEWIAAVQGAIDAGLITRHESGTFLQFTQAGEDLFA